MSMLAFLRIIMYASTAVFSNLWKVSEFWTCIGRKRPQITRLYARVDACPYITYPLPHHVLKVWGEHKGSPLSVHSLHVEEMWKKCKYTKKEKNTTTWIPYFTKTYAVDWPSLI